MKTVLSPEVAKEIEHEYKRLSSTKLVEACVRGQTQNANKGIPLFGQFVQRQNSCHATESNQALPLP